MLSVSQWTELVCVCVCVEELYREPHIGSRQGFFSDTEVRGNTVLTREDFKMRKKWLCTHLF